MSLVSVAPVVLEDLKLSPASARMLGEAFSASPVTCLQRPLYAKVAAARYGGYSENLLVRCLALECTACKSTDLPCSGLGAGSDALGGIGSALFASFKRRYLYSATGRVSP
jgi:hypothetical protein